MWLWKVYIPPQRLFTLTSGRLGTLIWKYLILDFSPCGNFSISGSSWLRVPNKSLSCLLGILLFGRSWIQLPCLQHHEFVESSAKFLSLLATTFGIDSYFKKKTQKLGSPLRLFLLPHFGSAIPHHLDGSQCFQMAFFCFHFNSKQLFSVRRVGLNKTDLLLIDTLTTL